MTTAPNAPVTRPGRTALVAVILAFAAGATDAFAFLQLGAVFTANMTGNLVLAGLVQRPDYAASLAGIVTAIAIFAATLYIALRYAEPGSTAKSAAVLAASVVAQVAVLALWATWPSPNTSLAVVPFIALSAVAMACQTAAARRLDSASGVTTTYVTGTITSLMANAADRKPQPAGLRIGVIAALVLGALAGALLIQLHPLYGAALPVLPAAVATVLTASAHALPGTHPSPRMMEPSHEHDRHIRAHLHRRARRAHRDR
ncbi:YoaK family protein [Microbacterium sp. 1P10UB]|uniref:YoaK family protein n=1 Tax=unclassified Microbacterium TaxID=2609290 RepID=UPI0039A16C95